MAFDFYVGNKTSEGELLASQWNFISGQNLTTLNLVNFIMHTPGEYDGRNWLLEQQWLV